MGIPDGIGIVDTMMGLPATDRTRWREPMAGMLRDRESREEFAHAASYMYRDLPDTAGVVDPAAFLLGAMDANGVAHALVPVDPDDEVSVRLVADHPDRFSGTYQVDPNQGMDATRALERAVRDHGVVAAVAFPCGTVPQVPLDDRRMWPVYAKCVDLGIPICVNTGIPGPRVPMAPQRVELLDEVCWAFPELTVVMRHGGGPWFALAAQLLRKWPNLHYSTSAYAPRRYPPEILDLARGRGREKLIYAGYFPSGLTLERTMAELADLPLPDEAWEPFLRGNAERVFGLSVGSGR